jgi:hypothetical protein
MTGMIPSHMINFVIATYPLVSWDTLFGGVHSLKKISGNIEAAQDFTCADDFEKYVKDRPSPALHV